MIFSLNEANEILHLDGGDNDAQVMALQWYYGESADTDKVQRVIDCLLKALSAERALP